MSSTNPQKSTDGPSRRQSASMGNFGNDNVDRSEETVLTRKQKRLQRRETLRLQAEVAPFLGMDLDDEEETKEKEETKTEEKVEVEKKEEPGKNVIGSPLATILEVDESTVDEEAVTSGLRPDTFKAPPSGGSEFPVQNDKKWWTRRTPSLQFTKCAVSPMSAEHTLEKMAAQHALYDQPSTILVDNKIRVVPYAVLQNVIFVPLIARPSCMKAFYDFKMMIRIGQRQDTCEHCYATFDVGMSDLGFVVVKAVTNSAEGLSDLTHQMFFTGKEDMDGMPDNTNRSIG
ncbi:hypothetical protein FVEN_g5400 [Fusarium venenatum]|uniref:Uncharacterized protein n=1 Tax=Fusarium venenatum TaxID=56646 RepID=A0A2L2TR10_9HYPO|nr:uncharacterized protein FVRRES_08518 [Fusarium venenatum]KAG8356810.1 hypothetical protein FVEN_g5400 [Fusarium venenatum]KAH6965289.1 hypothetical protein EDB82DRAFT_578988 [Fusarium venenatum]CEI68441.1 unnamed protein product [Fusarium venenatum]